MLYVLYPLYPKRPAITGLRDRLHYNFNDLQHMAERPNGYNDESGLVRVKKGADTRLGKPNYKLQEVVTRRATDRYHK